MGLDNFNRKQCIRALKKLGFYLDNGRSGMHDKFCFPENCSVSSGCRPFIMIPRHNELRLQRQIIQELKNIGGDQLVDAFRRLL
jgi:hypothetical protein